MLSLSARAAPPVHPNRLTAASMLVLLGAFAAALALAGLLVYSTKYGLLVLLAMCFVPLSLWRLQIGVCAWIVITFLSHVSAFSAYPNRVLLFVSACWIGLLVGRRSRRSGTVAESYVTVALIVVFISWTALTLAWAPDAGAAGTPLKQLAYGGFSVILLLGAVVERKHVRWIAAAFVFGASLSVLYGAAKGGLSGEATRVGTEVADSGGRFQGGASDPNYLAAVLVPAIMLAGGLAVRKAPGQRALLAIATVLIAIGLAASQSRGGLIAAIVCALVALVIWRGRRVLVGSLIALAGLATTTYFVLKPGTWTRILESNQGSGRLDIWTVALRVIHDHPFFGVGFGQFPSVSLHYVLQPGALQFVNLIVEKQIVVHSLYLQLLVEGGLVSLLLFLAIVGASLGMGWLAVRRFDAQGDDEMAAMARAAILALVGILVASIFLSDLENSQLWILLALGPVLAGLAKRQGAVSGRPSPMRRLRTAVRV
jgi:O-antigen ligase